MVRVGGKGTMTHVAYCIATANLPIARHMQHIALSDVATGGDKSQIVKYTRGDGVVDMGVGICVEEEERGQKEQCKRER